MNYITYKKIEVPKLKEIQQELTKFILPYCEGKPTGLWSVDMTKFFTECTNTVEYFTENNLYNKLKKVCYIVVHPGAGERDAHVDRNIEPPAESGDTSGCVSLNFGIQNYTETPVIFYEYLNGPKQYIPLPDPSEGSYIFYSEANLKEIDRYVLDNPTLMNNTVPHAISNDSNEVRITISFRFTQDPWHLFST